MRKGCLFIGIHVFLRNLQKVLWTLGTQSVSGTESKLIIFIISYKQSDISFTLLAESLLTDAHFVYLNNLNIKHTNIFTKK